MKPVIHHPWELSKEEALHLQQELAVKVVKTDHVKGVKLVAGVDVAYQKDSDRLVGAVVVLNAETLEVIETAIATDKSDFRIFLVYFPFANYHH